MTNNQWHLGTISGNYSSGDYLSLDESAITPIEKLEPTHAYETLDTPYYAGICKICEQPKSEHNLGLSVAAYLKTLCEAHRTLSPVLERKAQYWFGLLTEQEKVLAFQILEVTGTEVWK